METQEIEQLNGPMVLVVKGHSKKPRREIACELAKHLKYPIIDEDEITSVVQSVYNPDEKSFEIILKIALIQLTWLKLGVIISTPLCQKTHFDDLEGLAKSANAVLVIIQCLPKYGSNDFAIEGVPKFTVDTRNQPFVAEDFVSEELEKVRRRKYRHLHALIFNNTVTDEPILHCNSCREDIQGPSYGCFLGCDDYIFDKECAELKGDMDHVRKNCPSYLRVNEPEYLFPEKLRQQCRICESQNKVFSDSCYDCLFQTNMKGKFLPIIVNHESHAHPLNLVMMPLAYNYEFRCSGCGDFGHSISYKCYDCNFNLHVGCILLPRTVSYEYDKHPLRLTYDSLEQNYLDKSHCEACKNERNPEHWFYYCPTCESTIHLDCVTNRQ
ncbi:hypothetical protein DITRI_Ditri20bG0021500 [Diplodiscus trichospermus]